jgi:hypothetical protein
VVGDFHKDVWVPIPDYLLGPIFLWGWFDVLDLDVFFPVYVEKMFALTAMGS